MSTATTVDYRKRISRAIEHAASIAGLSEPELWERCCELAGHDPSDERHLDKGLELLAAAEAAETPVGILLEESSMAEEVRKLARKVRLLEGAKQLENGSMRDPLHVARYLAELLQDREPC